MMLYAVSKKAHANWVPHTFFLLLAVVALFRVYMLQGYLLVGRTTCLTRSSYTNRRYLTAAPAQQPALRMLLETNNMIGSSNEKRWLYIASAFCLVMCAPKDTNIESFYQ
ncbi:hypothetical protein [Pontibacter saemangeumensis]|uniref:hypothetical protein n=1 Tax=Pontibacter saemangeumensis TaxID=1084525 RepID=UPI0031E9AE52